MRQILMKHKSVFAKSLKNLKALNGESYETKVKPGVKPTKVTPRMLPHDAMITNS